MTEPRPKRQPSEPPNKSFRFKNRNHAFFFCKAMGRQVSIGKFYQDCANGYPEVYEDRSVDGQQVIEYSECLPKNYASPQEIDIEIPLRLGRSIQAIIKDSTKQEPFFKPPDSQFFAAFIVRALKNSISSNLDRNCQTILQAVGGEPEMAKGMLTTIKLLIDDAFKDCARSLDSTFQKDWEDHIISNYLSSQSSAADLAATPEGIES